MFKFLLYALLAYLAYSTFIRPLLGPTGGRGFVPDSNEDDEDFDYLDYEEIFDDDDGGDDD